MVDKIKKLLIKYKEIIMYGIFGVLTTVVSYVVFILFTELIVISKNTLFANISSVPKTRPRAPSTNTLIKIALIFQALLS